MAFEANVIPGSTPEVGGDVLTSLRNISAPRVIVPTNNIVIQPGETMRVEGSLVVDGTLIGEGVPSALEDPPLVDLPDVSISNLNVGNILSWNGTAFINTRAEFDFVDGVIDGGFPTTTYQEVLDIDGGFV
tara:strand:- start:570 stop:962 length:393 start_codon:yes stop_codon:yes gene_type:complete